MRNIDNIKIIVQTTNPSYMLNRQHVFRNGKELVDNSVINEDVYLKNPNFIIEINSSMSVMKLVKNDLEITMDNVIYTVDELLNQKCMVYPTLESNTQYVTSINNIFEQDDSYVFDITYDESKDNVLKNIDYILMLFKKNHRLKIEEKMLE